MRGRKPKILKLQLDGQPEVKVPSCPPHLKGEARAEWDRVVALFFDAGRITELDRAALAMYCHAWGRMIEAEQKIIETGGRVIKAPSGYPIKNPWASEADTAFKHLQQIIGELGMPWFSRGKKGAVQQPKTDSAGWDGLIANG